MLTIVWETVGNCGQLWTIVDNFGQLWTMAPIWSLTKGRAEGTRWTDGPRWRQSRVNEGFGPNGPPSSISSSPSLSTPIPNFLFTTQQTIACCWCGAPYIGGGFFPKEVLDCSEPKLLLVCLAAAALVALVESGSLSKLGVILLCLIFAPAADPKRIHYAKYKNKQFIRN